MNIQIPSASTSALMLLALVLCAVREATAQTPPDAGQTLQQLQPALPQPMPQTPLLPSRPRPETKLSSGGVQTQLQSVRFSGNTVFDSTRLIAELGLFASHPLDLAGLRGLADRVTDFYRAQGYPFATADLPDQNLTDGVLKIDVVEGRYGRVLAVSAVPGWSEQAQAYLAPLQPQQLIESAALERASLLLNDLPGITAWPLVRAGQQDGHGDLEVRVQREALFSGSLGQDNHGNRYTGKSRSRANLNINSPLVLGDQITLVALLSTENLRLGSADYSLPLGGDGLRGNVGYAHTSYVLGKEFESSQSYGTAKVMTAGFSYPILRSQQSNLAWRGSLQHKQLYDNSDTFLTRYQKSADSVPLSLQFDHRDSLGAGGVTYGVATWTVGKLHLDEVLLANDVTQTAGRFTKFTVDVARAHNLARGWSMYGHVFGQYTEKNLDSSELMSLGGAAGVRAYPSGEASGDRGWLAQLELRWNSGAWTSFMLWDQGVVQLNARPELVGLPSPDRNLAGAGVGLRYASGPWRAELTLAWRTRGGLPRADTSADPQPRAWLNAEYRF